MKLRLLIPLLFAAPLMAQTCTTSTCTAASTSESDVLAAMPSAGNHNATVMVNIPAGSSNWTTDFVYSMSTAPDVTNLTINGATVITWTGTAGQSNWNYTVNASGSQTIFNDADTSNNSLLAFTTGASGTKLTINGITLKGTASQGTKYAGTLGLGGSSRNIRLTNMYFNGTTNNSAEWIQTNGAVTGVMDHSVIYDGGGATDAGNGLRIYSAPDDNIGYGDGAWKNGPQFGTLLPFYMESDYFFGGISNDCINGGRFVERYSTFDSNYTAIQTHGTKSTGGGDRSCISYEAYHNYITHPSGPAEGDGAFGSKGGTSLIWANTMVSGSYYRFFNGSTDRNGGDNSPETNTPNGWGYCGTSTPIPPGSTPNGVGSCWDGNVGGGGTCSGATTPTPSATGYPCLDELGRGQDTQALNGKFFTPAPGRLNTVTGTIAWPHQYLDPMYFWNNTIPGSTYVNVSGDPNMVNNRDYFYDQSAQSGSFTGAAGTGFGLHSARPATCTAGPGGTNGTSAVGSNGVLYFATDDGPNGTGWACTSTNTWTSFYQPLGFPHPLVSSTPQASAPTFSPSSGAPPQTVTISTTSGGVICYNTTGSPQTNGGTGCTTGTKYTAPVSVASPQTLYAVAGGTGFLDSSINSATYATATFTLSPSTSGTGSGTNVCTPTGAGIAAGTSVSCTMTAAGGSVLTTANGCGFSLTGTTYSGSMPASNCSPNAQFDLIAGTCTDPIQNSPNYSGTYTCAAGSCTSIYGTTPYPVAVGFTSSTPGCAMFATFDTSTPNCSSASYGGTTLLYADETIRVIACRSGYTSSSVIGGTWNVSATAATPTFSPSPGGYGSAQTVTISDATSGVTLCYTTNGTTPTTDGAGTCLAGTSLYSVPFLVSSTSTVKAVATKSGGTDSAIASGLYTINGSAAVPTFSPVAGTYGPTQTVTISTGTSGATICWTNDGSTPTADGAGTCTHGTTYAGTVSVSSSLTLKSIASKSGWNDSSVASAAYVINGAASTPTFSPVAGSYGPTQNVTISTSTSGATVCYTTTGATPDLFFSRRLRSRKHAVRRAGIGGYFPYLEGYRDQGGLL